MNTTKNITLIILILLVNSELSAQQSYFKITSSYRIRSEFRQGYRTLFPDSAKHAFFTGQRARITLDYNKDKVQFFASIQDARTWGDEEIKQDIATLQVNELWTELGLKNNLTIKLGRQELVYDDHRLLGNLDWANQTISHDAVLLKYNNPEKAMKAHLGLAYNNSGEPVLETRYPVKQYNAMGFLWLKKEIKSHHSISFLTFLQSKKSIVSAKDISYATLTLGPLYNFNNNKIKSVLGAYYQTGKTETAKKTSAFMINAYGEYKLNKTSLGIGVDYLSGDTENTNSATETNTFNTLYATNHKFYGYMDYFLAIPADTKNRGLADIYFKTTTQLNSKTNIHIDGHSFFFPKSTTDSSITSTHYSGTELDIVGEYKPNSIINLQLGYSFLIPADNMQTVKTGNIKHFNYWAFIMLKVSPTLLLHEFK